MLHWKEYKCLHQGWMEMTKLGKVHNNINLIDNAFKKGYVVQKYKEIHHLPVWHIGVSKYYLDRCPVDRTLQGYMATPQYVDPPEEPKSIEISDYIKVIIGNLIGKGGLVLWAAGEFIWFQDETNILRSDDHTPDMIPFLRVQAAMVECTCLPATIKFTKERGYDVRPGDVVSVACGPEFQTKGVVTVVDFINTQLTLDTKGDHALIKVPICFMMKTQNVDLDDFKKFINIEVFIIRGEKKGFQAMLYALSLEDCIVAVHSLPHMNAKRHNVATTYGCRLKGAMLEDAQKVAHRPSPLKHHTSPREAHTYTTRPLYQLNILIDTGSSTEDPWVVNPSDSLPVADLTAVNPCDSLIWLRDFAVHFYTYHALFHVSAGFQGGKLVKWLGSSHSPDPPFCGPNDIAPPGQIAVWCTAKTAGGARVDYHIPIEFLTPAQPRKKGQECFIMNVDDSTAVIECVLRHPPPYANVDRKSMSTQEWRALRKIPPPPPPHVITVSY
ncbi:hypothetical protein P692DRAFT_20870194 [Suillus brevipes Sb2]|nr:hypothetical protein P692DRAFT_20870194 [Suillus brevipes Sb2]